MKSKFVVNLKEYYDALDVSIHDNEWFDIAFNQHENIMEFTKQFSNKPDIAATNYLKNKDYTEILKYKNKPINENVFNFFMSPHQESVKFELIKNIKNKTKYLIENIKFLLEEYSENTRHFFEAQINPYPEQIQDTCRPINAFKVISENTEFIVKIKSNNIDIQNDKTIKTYFDDRNLSKNIERAYTNQNLEKEIRNLVFEKNTSIPTNVLFKENGKYKIVFKKNQCIENNDSFKTINGSDFVVKMILRQNES